MHIALWVHLRFILLIVSTALSVKAACTNVYKASRGALPWTRCLLPVIVAVELSKIAFTHGSRSTLAYFVLGFEGFVVVYAAVSIVRLRRSPQYRSTVSILYESAAQFLPEKIAELMTSELMTVGLAFTAFRQSDRSATNSINFVAETPQRYLWLIVLVGSVPECFLLHLALKHHPLVEAVLFVGTVWGFLWVIGYYVGFRDNSHSVCGDIVTVRYSFYRTCSFPVSDVTHMSVVRDASRSSFSSYHPWQRFCINHCTLVKVSLASAAESVEFSGKKHAIQKLAISVDNSGLLLRTLSTSSEMMAAN